MSALQILRQARALARFALVWFVLSLGLAVAAPLVQPQSMALVCTASGDVKLLASNDDGGVAAPSHTLHCVFCFIAGAPPAAAVALADPAYAPGAVAPARAAQTLAWRTAAPAPARGPPASA